MKKKATFKENLARIKDDLSIRVEQLEKALIKNPCLSPTKSTKS